METVNTQLEKYDNFKAAQLRSIQQLSDSTKIITIVIQDDDGEDVESVNIEFKGINSSNLLVDSVLPFLDMMSGVSIIKENDLYGFAIGKHSAMLHVRSAPLYIIASEIKIEKK